MLAVSCGGATQADVDQLTGSIRALEDRGASFTLTVTETETGGDIPKGKYGESIYTAKGVERNDQASFVLGTRDPSTGQTTADFDVVVNDSDVFVRPHGSTREWYTSWTYVAEQFIPGLRLNLVRDTVLLARSVNRTTSYTNGAFLTQFAITPATDQLRQLMSFSSAGTLTASLSPSGGTLQSIAGHFTGKDAASKRNVTVDSTVSFSAVGRAAAIKVPPGGVAVQPADLFSTSTASG